VVDVSVDESGIVVSPSCHNSRVFGDVMEIATRQR
jgi:hypothetical protein